VPILGQIRGQPRVVELLRRAMAQGRVPHAYLFTGPAGAGKHATALALAAAMNCERAPGEGCGTCGPCERIEAGRHPDVTTLERQGPSQSIPIEVIRKQVIPALGLPPHEGRARLYLIEEATCLLDPAANALLKTLEEPPARTHFVLCTGSPNELLPTIRSRCQRVIFQPVVAAEAEGGEDPALGAIEDLIAGPGDRMKLALIAEALTGGAGERAGAARAVRLLAQRLHAEACAAARDGDLARAADFGAKARAALDCEWGLTVHNANAQLAIERLVRELDRVAS
jgi:DNA polymerase III delta' subunit